MPNHQRAAAHRTTLARQPGSISGETRLRAADQPIVATQELPSAVPLMALSTGFWAFKTLAAAHELGLFSNLAGGAGTTVAELAEALGIADQRVAGETNQRREPEVAALAHVAENARDRRMRQRALFAQ